MKDLTQRGRAGEELLDLTSAEHDQLISSGKLVHSENRDDVLKVFVALEHVLHATSNTVVLFANDIRSKRIGVGSERIHRG